MREAYLFDSCARETVKDYSDVDIAIVLGKLKNAGESPFYESFEFFHAAQKYNSLLEDVCFAQAKFD